MVRIERSEANVRTITMNIPHSNSNLIITSLSTSSAFLREDSLALEIGMNLTKNEFYLLPKKSS
jgi:hypothetical protein